MRDETDVGEQGDAGRMLRSFSVAPAELITIESDTEDDEDELSMDFSTEAAASGPEERYEVEKFGINDEGVKDEDDEKQEFSDQESPARPQERAHSVWDDVPDLGGLNQLNKVPKRPQRPGLGFDFNVLEAFTQNLASQIATFVGQLQDPGQPSIRVPRLLGAPKPARHPRVSRLQADNQQSREDSYVGTKDEPIDVDSDVKSESEEELLDATRDISRPRPLPRRPIDTTQKHSTQTEPQPQQSRGHVDQGPSREEDQPLQEIQAVEKLADLQDEDDEDDTFVFQDGEWIAYSPPPRPLPGSQLPRGAK
ncbi:hypothetical protein LTS18_000681, partial [Coniosporium uncinatum]